VSVSKAGAVRLERVDVAFDEGFGFVNPLSQSLDDERLVSDDAPNGVGRTRSGQRLRRFCASLIAPPIVGRLCHEPSMGPADYAEVENAVAVR
jgi:hypothetical protein